MCKLLLVRELDLDLVLATDALHLHIGVQGDPHLSGRALEGLWRRYSHCALGVLGDRKQWCETFCLTNRQTLVNDLSCKPDAAILAWDGKDRPGVPGRQVTLVNELLNLLGKVEKTYGVRDRRAGLGQNLRELLLGESLDLDQLSISTSLLKGSEV